MSNELKAGSDASRREMLRLQLETEEKIRRVYLDAAAQLAREADAAKSGGLTERWKEDMAQSLADRVRGLGGEVSEAVLDAARTAANLGSDAQTDWWNMLLDRAGVEDKAGASFRSVLTRAPDEALKQVVTGQAYLDGKGLDSRVWTAAGRLDGGIQQVLEQGIAQKRSAYQIAKDLEQYIKPGAGQPMDWLEVYPDIPFPISVDYNAQRLARTSINHAYHLAMVESAQQNPFVDAIHWELSPSHYSRQILPFGADVCDEYAMHNEGLGVGNFPVKNVPLPHPGCLCYQYPLVNRSLAECAKELRDWLDGEPNEVLDQSYGAWKVESGID